MMEVRVQIDRHDLWQAARYINFRMPRRAIVVYACLFVFLWSVYSGAVSGLTSRPPEYKLVIGLLTMVLVAVPLCLVLYFLAKWATLRSAARTPGLLGEHRYTIDETGLREQTTVNDGRTAWTGISDIVVSKHQIYFLVGPRVCHVIPRRAFRDDAEMQAFLERARSSCKAARAGQQNIS